LASEAEAAIDRRLPDPRTGVTSTWSWWSWGGHRIRCLSVCGPDPRGRAVLIHGFGACIGHWRHTLPALAKGFDVHAIDLLGFGASDKPRSRLADEPALLPGVRYCFDLWAEQVVAYVQEKVRRPGRDLPLHLIGNSIGGLVALNAARLLSQADDPPSQVVLIDCTQRGLDEKRMVERSGFERGTRPLLKHLVSRRWLIAPLFRLLARPTVIRRVLKQAYPTGAHVDEELVALLHGPATDPGAVESFRGFINLFDDHLAPDLLAELNLPVRMLWGARDPWESAEEAQRWQRTYPCVADLQVLDDLGHCPHDEDPERVNPILLEWLTQEGGVARVPQQAAEPDPGAGP
jgi:pimeloyl-ACP methyl ester carboxylesterase